MPSATDTPRVAVPVPETTPVQWLNCTIAFEPTVEIAEYHVPGWLPFEFGTNSQSSNLAVLAPAKEP